MTTNRYSITGFLVIKNGISQGYPFVEAIISAIPICDEFLISDGYSNDGTWSVLQKLSQKYPKIKLFQDKWIEKSKNGEEIADITNKLKKRCHGDYLFYIQANEIYHEDTLDQIKQLPNLYPYYEIFRFPFYNFIGDKYIISRDHSRIRFFKNNKNIINIQDGWSFRYSNLFIVKNYLIRPFVMKQLILHNIDEFSIHIYLKYPVFRFRSLFPGNFIKKLDTHLKLWSDSKLNNILSDEYLIVKLLLDIDDYDLFWERYLEKYWNDVWKGKDIMRKYEIYSGDYPKLIKKHLHKWNYSPYYLENGAK